MRHWRETLQQDIQYALRTAGKSPGFVLAAAGTLALGIGATTAIFSILSGVLLRPLPFGQPDRLVQLTRGGHPQRRRGLLRRHERLANTGRIIGGNRRLHVHQQEPARHRRTRAHTNPLGGTQPFPRAGRRAHLRPDLHGERPAGRRRIERQPMEAPLRRRPLLHRTQDQPQQRTVHHHRRNARDLSVPLPCIADRNVDPLEHAAATGFESQFPDRPRRGTSEAGSDDRSGAPGVERPGEPAGGTIPRYQSRTPRPPYAARRIRRRTRARRPAHLARRRRTAPADRLRECGQPAAGSRCQKNA